MARRKMWFLTTLHRCLTRTKAVKMFKEMGLTSAEIEVLIKRFWHGEPIKSVGALSASEQKRRLPTWDRWSRNWCASHPDFFTREELAGLGQSEPR